MGSIVLIALPTVIVLWAMVALWKFATKTSALGKSLPVASVKCPKCRESNAADQMICSNCSHVGAKAKVITLYSVRNIFWTCPACHQPMLRMPCKQCGTELSGLFKK